MLSRKALRQIAKLLRSNRYAHANFFTSQVNLDLTIAVLSFLLSDNALFLRDALINELLDTMDEVGFSLCSSVPPLPGSPTVLAFALRESAPRTQGAL